jgi:hypothetical protein
MGEEVPPQGRLYGRDDIVNQIVALRDGIVIISGDSGLGKSAVLMAAAARTTGAVAPPPVVIGNRPGGLQDALLRSCALALADALQREGAVGRAASTVVEATKHFVKAEWRGIGAVIGQEVLALNRGRLGPDVGKAVEEYVQELRETVDQNLAARIRSVSDAATLNVILQLTTELATATSTKEFVISLDKGERLFQGDRGLLADLGAELPVAIRLRVGFATESLEDRAGLDYLVGLGATEVPLPPLERPDVAQWLADEGLSAVDPDRVRRVAAGSPLLLLDLMHHLREGGELEDLPIGESFRRSTRRTLDQLQPGASRAARLLAAFEDPPPRGRIAAYLEADAAEWSVIEDELARSTIFSVTVDGQRWFHEQRRRYIWEETLEPPDRSTFSEHAAWELKLQADSLDRLPLLARLPRLIASASDLLARDPELALVSRLDRAALAVLSGLIELREPASALPGVEGDLLLQYARDRSETEGNLVESLRSLAALGLVNVVENGRFALVTPSWTSEWTPAMIVGRAAGELAYVPIPRTASAAFGTHLRSPLGAFIGAITGIGKPSVAVMVERYVAMARAQSDPMTFIAAPERPGLLVRGSYGSRPLFVVASYPAEDQRDLAYATIQGFDKTFLGERIRAEVLFSHPLEMLPSRRFFKAVELLAAGFYGNTIGVAQANRQLGEPLTLESALQARLQTLAAVRERSSGLERTILGLDEHLAYFFAETGTHRTEIEVRGGRSGVYRDDGLLGTATWGSFLRFRIAERLQLAPGEQIGRITFGSGFHGREDPVIATLQLLHERAVAFNRYQRPRRIELDAVAIQHAVETALRVRVDDASQLQQQTGLGLDWRPVPQQIYIGIAPPSREEGAVHFDIPVALVGRGESEDGAFHVSVRILDQPLEHRIIPEAVWDQLGITSEEGEALDWDEGDIYTELAELLGYRQSEVRVGLPPEWYRVLDPGRRVLRDFGEVLPCAA